MFKQTTQDRRSVSVGLGNPTASAYLRLLSAASIVWFHTAPANPIGSFGAVGLVMFVYLSFLSAPKPKDYLSSLNRNARGFLVPWAVWWVFYALEKAWFAGGIPPLLGPETNIWVLMQGPAIHLWFLPFLFLSMMAVHLIRAVAIPLPDSFKISIALTVGILGISFLKDTGTLPEPLRQMLLATPAVALGLSYLWVMRIRDRRSRSLYFLAIAAAVNVAAIPIWFYGETYIAIGYSGASLTILLLLFRWPRSRTVMHLSLLSMGIYLIHPFALTVIRKFLGADVSEMIIQAPLAFVLSGLATWVIMQSKFLRKIVFP